MSKINSESDASGRPGVIHSVRVSPHGYFAVLFLASFFSGLLIYLEFETAGLIVFGSACVVIPILAFTDRISFDGKRLKTTGVRSFVHTILTGSPKTLRIRDVEQVETQALRVLKRGSNVSYRYSTIVRGKGRSFTLASGGKAYRQMIKTLLMGLNENVLDTRSIELRDYLVDPKEVLSKAAASRIPSADVLESSVRRYIKERDNSVETVPDNEVNTAELQHLRSLANELRLSGYLLQALEAFRRALLLDPRNGWLLLECGRCLQSFAGSQHDEKLERRSIAILRLSEKRAGHDSELLARLGESYFQTGNWTRAGQAFRKASEAVGESFRSVRGLAEIALREGKIAHVIHNFSTAHRLAESGALRRWTQNEADYFSRLNDDEEYLEMEVSRMNLHDRLERYQKTALKVTLFGFPSILIGVLAEEYDVANFGWAISTIAVLAWAGISFSQRLFADRISLDLVTRNDDF